MPRLLEGGWEYDLAAGVFCNELNNRGARHMKRLRKAAAAVLVAGGTMGAWFYGSSLVKDVQFAAAEERVEATREQLAKVEDLSSVFRTVGKAVEPSVVNIRVRK